MFTFEKLCKLRPIAYHICSSTNFESIRASRLLISVCTLLCGTEYESHLHGRRNDSLRVTVNGQEIEVPDQRPLRPGSLHLPVGYSINEYVNELNARVFLWAGTETGPVPSGKRHVAHRARQGKVSILRVPLASLCETNFGSELQVTFCNSGSARHQSGHPVSRGPNIFQSPLSAVKSPSKVVEITCRGQIALPPDTLWSENLHESWTNL